MRITHEDDHYYHLDVFYDRAQGVHKITLFKEDFERNPYILPTLETVWSLAVMRDEWWNV